MLLFRYFLIGLAIYLLVRSFVRYNEESRHEEHRNDTGTTGRKGRKIPKELGEYVDYEEVKDDE
ncbi:MAG TPA: hypothetical protein VJ963_06130 [Bacteroidales bacterium]|nr:hypothetical protein [Bacteroidales bacterium]